MQVGEGNLQAMAREARYGALAFWVQRRGLVAVVTAHHADDQAETLIMRLNRGSGVAGLAGVRERGYFHSAKQQLVLLRPLLEWRRSDLRTIVDGAGICCATDPSNSSESFDRVRVRNALAMTDLIDPVALSRSAAYLADADEALDEVARFAWSRLSKRDDGTIAIDPIGPRVIAIRVVQGVFKEFEACPTGGEIARLLNALERSEKCNLAGVLAEVKVDELRGPLWVFRPEPPRRTKGRTG